jgi:hypothetical protein
MAAKPNYDEEGFSWLHRINRRLKLVGNVCPLPTVSCSEEVTPYCYEGLGGAIDSDLGVNAAVSN